MDVVLEFFNSINLHSKMRVMPSHMTKKYQYKKEKVENLLPSFGDFDYLCW